ncbi:MAG: NAD(P)-dependent oxidoreductase [Planctomycetota bacterium]
MRIGVTGVTGFLGRYIVEYLTQQGHTCRAWYRATSNRGGLAVPPERLEWVPGELGDRESSRRLMPGCDAVVHGALHHEAERFRAGPGDLLEFVRRNVLGTLELIQAARAVGVRRFVFVSTCAVHERILDDRPLDETHPLWPMTHYGAHKAALEAFVHSYGFGEGYEICAVRPTGIYGLAHPASASKWYDLVQTVAAGRDVTCTGGGKEVHALDVAKAIGLLLEAPGIAGEAYNCCDRYISEHEVAQVAKRLTGSSSVISGEPRRPKHDIETGKLRALGMQFGGLPFLESTIKQMLAATLR